MMDRQQDLADSYRDVAENVSARSHRSVAGAHAVSIPIRLVEPRITEADVRRIVREEIAAHEGPGQCRDRLSV